jgi:hypothetical protein
MEFASAPLIRPAMSDDLAAIVPLTRARRKQLAAWEPWYWNPREGIDETHPMFLGWCIEHNPTCDVTVAIEHGVVVGCVFAQRRPDHTFLDDFCVADERWEDIASPLIETSTAVQHLICAPSKDSMKHQWLERSPFTWASTFFSLRTPAADPSHRTPEFLPLPKQLEQPPSHVFGVFDANTENGLRVSTADGYAIGSAPALPPPFDPGGPTTIIDRICGSNRRTVLDLALQEAARRSDVQVIVVVDRGDQELTNIVNDLGATRPVNLWRSLSSES